MTTICLSEQPVEVNEEGFFVDPTQWTEEMATEIAEECGVPTPLTDKHWQVLHFMRSNTSRRAPVRRFASSEELGCDRQGALPALSEGPGKTRRPRAPAFPSHAAASNAPNHNQES